jgi:hypothetical protein
MKKYSVQITLKHRESGMSISFYKVQPADNQYIAERNILMSALSKLKDLGHYDLTYTKTEEYVSSH